jgi:hypothetical protein
MSKAKQKTKSIGNEEQDLSSCYSFSPGACPEQYHQIFVARHRTIEILACSVRCKTNNECCKAKTTWQTLGGCCIVSLKTSHKSFFVIYPQRDLQRQWSRHPQQEQRSSYIIDRMMVSSLHDFRAFDTRNTAKKNTHNGSSSTTGHRYHRKHHPIPKSRSRR